MNRIIAARCHSQQAALFRSRSNSVLPPMSAIHTAAAIRTPACSHSNGSNHQSPPAVVAGVTMTIPTTTTTARRNMMMHPFGGIRFFSDAKDSNSHEAPTTEEPPSNNNTDSTTEEQEGTNGTAEGVVPDEQQKLKLMEVQIKDLKNQLLRSLADQENTRRIAKRDVESAKQFAIKSFAKSLLETSDNLERALDAVPQDLLQPDSSTTPDLHGVLVTLYEGIRMTEEGLNKALQSNGLERFGTVGDIFDPNLHEALFEYPDPTKEPGTLGQVMKPGFLLNKRVLRPAEVGVIKKEA
jgi:molecular chaperone GrpE